MWIRLKDQTQEYFLTFVSVIQVMVQTTGNWMFYFLEDMFPLMEEAASVLNNLVSWMRGENVFKKLTHIQLPVVTTVGGMPFNWYGSMKEHP